MAKKPSGLPARKKATPTNDAKPSKSAQLADLVVGNRKSIRDCVNWLWELERCKLEVTDALRQCLDAASLPADCQHRALFDLRNWVNKLNKLLVEGLNVRLGCFGTDVRERVDPYARALLEVTVTLLARPNIYDEEFLNRYVDRITPAMAAFFREFKTLTKLLALAQRVTTRRLNRGVVKLANDARDKWLYKMFGMKEQGELVPYKAIVTRLKTECSKRHWRYSSDITSLKKAANRWAQHNHKPPIPKRQHGRRSVQSTSRN